MRYDYFWGGGDLFAQLGYILENEPDNCLTELIFEWYNSLYSELGNDNEFKCCELSDIENPPQNEILDFLLGLGFSALEGTLTQFLILELVNLGRVLGERAIDDIADQVKRQIALELGAPV